MLWTQIVFLVFFWHSEQFMYTTCSELIIFKYWTDKSKNNHLSYYGLVDVRINASDKDLPVLFHVKSILNYCGQTTFLLSHIFPICCSWCFEHYSISLSMSMSSKNSCFCSTFFSPVTVGDTLHLHLQRYKIHIV